MFINGKELKASDLLEDVYIGKNNVVNAIIN